MKTETKQAGYIGILSLLIGVAIIAYLAVKQYSSLESTGRSGVTEQNVQSGIQAIEQAKKAKEMLEQRNANTTEIPQ